MPTGLFIEISGNYCANMKSFLIEFDVAKRLAVLESKGLDMARIGKVLENATNLMGMTQEIVVPIESSV